MKKTRLDQNKARSMLQEFFAQTIDIENIQPDSFADLLLESAEECEKFNNETVQPCDDFCFAVRNLLGRLNFGGLLDVIQNIGPQATKCFACSHLLTMVLSYTADRIND